MRSLKPEEIDKIAKSIAIGMVLSEFEILLAQINRSISDDERDPDYRSQVFRIVSRANVDGWADSLINILMLQMNQNAQFLELANNLGLSGRRSTNLEAQVDESSEIRDLAATRRKWIQIEQQVCRVEIKAPALQSSGTGFLVGPDLIMTNYHVVESLIKNEISPEHIIVRFDYITLEGDATHVINKGTEHFLDPITPVIEHSPYTEFDTISSRIDRNWPTDQLDFAILKLKKEAGKELAGGMPKWPGSKVKPRGWIPFPASGFTLQPDDYLIIFQHPQDKPISFAEASNAVIGLNSNEQRVRHRVTTQKGSSGSPCFNSDYKLVALHHAGDPLHFNPGFNQGIPINLIALFLKSKGNMDLLSFGEVNLDAIEIPEVIVPGPSIAPVEVAPNDVYLNDTAPFIPRPIFNRTMTRMIQGLGSRVISLEGKSKSGLTYSFQFINQLASFRGYRCIYLSLSYLFSEAGTAQSLPLAEHLLSKMQITYDAPVDEEFKLTVFFSSFSGAVNEKNEKFVIFIDDLATFPMTTGCISFIQSLALAVQNDIKDMYLILAGFKNPFPEQIKNVVKKVALKSFSENNIEDFLQSFYNLLPSLVDKNPEETLEEFIENSKMALNTAELLAEEPNVEEVGLSIKEYCDTVIDNLF